MVTIDCQPIEEIVGKNVIEDIKTIQKAVEDILKNNIALRALKYRHIVRLLVEDKLGRKVNDESVPRACRHIQNTLGIYKPEVEDNRIELEEIHHKYYSPQE